MDRWWLEGHLFLFHVLELQAHVSDWDYFFGHMAAHADLTPYTHRVVELTGMVIEDQVVVELVSWLQGRCRPGHGCDLDVHMWSIVSA